MHKEAYEWIKQQVHELELYPATVVEIGSRNINGTVRPIFEGHGAPEGVSYTGVDIAPGPGVDVVANGADYKPKRAPDVVVSAEMLEHYEDAAGAVANMIGMLKPGGWLILTMATDPREPHSAVDGYGLKEGEHYANITKTELEGWLDGLEGVRIARYGDRGDLYAVAQKPATQGRKAGKAAEEKS